MKNKKHDTVETKSNRKIVERGDTCKTQKHDCSLSYLAQAFKKTRFMDPN